MSNFDMNFLKHDEYLHDIQECYSYLRAPVFIMWDMTNKCNFRCIHCYNHSGSEPKYADLSDEDLLKLCRQIIEINPVLVCFCGGEPLCRGNIIFDLAKMLTDSGILVNMVSNGSLITEEVAAKIKQAEINAVQVSLDGSNEKTNDYFRGVKGAFKLAIRGINNLNQVGYPVPVTFIPTRVNYRELHDVIELVYNMGCRSFRMMPLVPIGRGAENLRELELTDEDNWNLTWSILKARQKYPDCVVEWGDPLEHLYLFPNNPVAKTYTYEIRSNGDVVLSSYLPLIVGNAKENHLQELWDAGLSEIWRYPKVKEWAKRIISLKDIENQEVMPWESNDILIELIPPKEKDKTSLENAR